MPLPLDYNNDGGKVYEECQVTEDNTCMAVNLS